MEKRQVLDFREVRRMLWRRRWLIVVPLAATIALATYRAMTMPATYSSTAALAPENPMALTRQVQEVADPGGGGRGGRRGRDNDAELSLRSRVMSSRFLESVAVQIGLHENPALRARAEAEVRRSPGHDVDDLVLRQCVMRLREMVSISSIGGVINITAVSTSPRLAQIVAQAVTDQYLQTTRQLRLRSTEETAEFARDQLEIYEARLEEKQSRLRTFQERQALKPLARLPVNTGSLTRVAAQLAEAQDEVQVQNERLREARQRIVEQGLKPYLDTGVVSSPKLDGLKKTFYELERALALALVEQGDPALIAGERNAVAVKAQQILSEIESLTDSGLPNLSDERRRLIADHEFLAISVGAAGARADELRGFRSKYASDLAGIPADEFRLHRLEEEVESAQRLRQTWVDQLNATQLAKSVLSAEGVSERLIILEPALLPLRPFAPDRLRIFLVAVGLGIALGVGAAVVAEYMDLTLKSVDEIEAVLEMPILGAVPRMQSAVFDEMEANRRRRVWVYLSSSAAGALILAIAGWFYWSS